jgi:hypothetical protein
MPRRKSTDAAVSFADDPTEANVSPTENVGSGDAPPVTDPDASKSKWVPRFGSFGDYEAGVHLVEDRENKRMLIKFDEKPSEQVRTLLKSPEYGYRFDGAEQVWYKFISQARPRQSRREADDLFLKVANMIREEKGLEPRAAVSQAL